MKKILVLAFISALVFSCNSEKRTDYVINGTAKGVYNGIRVYLKTTDLKLFTERVIDTAIVLNEKFSFEGTLENPEFRVLTVDNVAGKLPFILENSSVTIEIDKTDITSSKVSGSVTQDTYKKYESELNKIKEKNLSLVESYKNALRAKNENLKDSLSDILKDVRAQMTQFPIRFIESNNDSPLALILIEEEIDKRLFAIETYKDAFDYLDDDLKNSPKGRLIATKINALFQIEKGSKYLEIGQIAPNFEAPTPDGDIVSLNQLKGKVTIIDFWAAWCGPCRKENPNVVRIYNQYHNQGLEIIGVSLDGQSRQNDAKKAWVEAIKKDNLTWHQVSYLKYFNDPVAQLYNIQSIPATFILDSEGKIAAKNLRGKALELKVQELLNQ